MNGWMIGCMVILVSKLWGCFCFFPKQLVNCVGLVSNVQMPVSWTASSVWPYYMHRRFNDHAATNKQTNGCTWVDERIPRLFFLSFFRACLLQTLNTHLQTLRVSVRWHTSCSQPSPPASHGCKIGGSYSTPMAHNWIACRACLRHPPTSGNNNNNNNKWGTGYGYGPTKYQSLLVTGPTTSKV